MRTTQFQPIFVKYIPEKLEEGKLYISMEYATASHLCACGCGEKVVTPISPKFWQMYYNGKEISLTPSIGNYEFPCQSHYFIRYNRVEWCTSDSDFKHSKRKKKRKKKEMWEKVKSWKLWSLL
jgi:hypothetical protein